MGLVSADVCLMTVIQLTLYNYICGGITVETNPQIYDSNMTFVFVWTVGSLDIQYVKKIQFSSSFKSKTFFFLKLVLYGEKQQTSRGKHTTFKDPETKTLIYR